MDLQESREVIRQVDEEMAKLFVKRMEAVRSVAAYKKERGLPIEDKEQEARVIKGRSALVEDPELRSFYVNFLQDTMDVSKRWQHYLMEGLRVAYSGVEGAFAHIAGAFSLTASWNLIRPSSQRTKPWKRENAMLRCCPSRTVSPAKSDRCWT